MPISLPNDIFQLQGEDFLNVVQQQCGNTMCEIFRYLEINSADCLLDTHDLFAVFRHSSPDLMPMKEKVGITLNDGSFLVKKGLLFQANILLQTLHALKQQTNFSISKNITVSSVFVDQYPILRNIIHIFDNSSSQLDRFLNSFKYKTIETIISNHDRAKTHYSYSDSIRNFAACIFILGGRNVYEFIRINVPGLLPSPKIIQDLLDSSTSRCEEGEFRYDSLFNHLVSQGTNLIYVAEDCTAVIPRIVYDAKTNTFVGFTSPLENGLPKINSFSTNSFTELENWFNTVSKSHFLNIQMIRLISLNICSGSDFLLGAYGTDNQYTTNDVLIKWLNIVDRCNKKNVKVVGFATDCDSRYMRSMRLLSGFFADMPNQQPHMRDDAFVIKIPKNWNWFFMRNRQLILFFQDSIHLCTKFRNRLLSSKATMLFGDELISVDHLIELIESSSKMNHNLVKSDILVKDRQNFSSCEKLSNKSVLDALASVPNSRGTRLYLQLIQNIRFAFIDKEIPYLDRVYYSWKNVFLIRYWYIWLNSKSKNHLDFHLSKLSPGKNHQKKKTKQQFFISLPSLFSMEINSHTLVYLGVLVIQQHLPPECLDVSVFSSQSCENVFRLCRAMSGTFSSIVNFSVYEFLQRVKKLSFLNSVKSRNHSNDTNVDLIFPRHHKQPTKTNSQPIPISSSSVVSLSLESIESIIRHAYLDVCNLLVDMNVLEQNQLLSLEKMSQQAYLQLKKSRIIDYSCPDEYDPDFDSDSNISSSDDDDEDRSGNDVDCEESIDEDDYDNLSIDRINISTSAFQGMRVFDSINPNMINSYFVVHINGVKKYLHKQTGAWYLSKDKSNLSSDRLKRVMTRDE